MSHDRDRPFSTVRRAVGGGAPPAAVQERIVQALLVKLARRRRRRQVSLGLLAAAAAAAALLATAVVWRTRGPVPSSAPTARAPQDEVTPRPGAAWRTAFASARVRVGPHSLDLGPRSHVVLETRSARSTALAADEGRVTFEVARLRDGSDFRVRTPAVVVEVVGTRFTTDVQGACTRLDVHSGVVRATPRPPGTAELLGAGATRRFCLPAPPVSKLSAAEEQLRLALQLIVEGRELEHADRLLARYLAENPRAALAEDALFHRIQLQLRAGRCAAATSLASVLRRRFPDGGRAERVRRLTNERCPVDPSDQP